MSNSDSVFKYAKLFDPNKSEYDTTALSPSLVYGPEVKRRIEQNTEECAVTVCCISYNHEQYIEQAIQGFLMQKTKFKYKVFIGEDHGSDGTAAIIKRYAEQYPDIIVPFFREKNMGAQRNLIDLCNHACSPYIAFCEGDDFWIDEYKLQKQYDYMQANPEIRMCYTATEILADEDWHLNEWYEQNDEGKMIIPYCTPGFEQKDFYTAGDFFKVFPNHTSSAFYRWNYDLDIPDWFYDGLIGDTPITIMQMGLGKAVYLDDVTSVYRRSSAGVFMNASNAEHFANTRLDYLRLLNGLKNYFSDHFDKEYQSDVKLRLMTETTNYLRVAASSENKAMVERLFDTYPDDAFLALKRYVKTYNAHKKLRETVGKSNTNRIIGTKGAGYFAKGGLFFYNLFYRASKLVQRIIDILKRQGIVYRYWKNSRVDKKNNSWVFTGFRGTAYMDNSMYLYEYVIKNHPEIEAVWVTRSDEIYEKLQAEHKPVVMADSREGMDIVSRANCAIIDHFVMSDFGPESGINDNTKIVQLWHGVGFKSMGDGEKVKNTKEKGVRYCYDILAEEGDSALTILKKRILYHFRAPFREKFEKYFMLVCPGQERVEMIGNVWNIPEDRYFIAGHPRNIPVYESIRQENPIKVMYAPTYRFNEGRESAMVNSFLSSMDEIQKLMDRINGTFTLRMHPHTWRNYEDKIKKAMEPYSRITLDDTPDIYTSLGTYSVLVSDYSSIAMDFALLGRPVIFIGEDFDWFEKKEAGFNIDFKNSIPGPFTKSWEETIKVIEECGNDLHCYEQLRKEKCRYFFDVDKNGPDDSERIVCEIKRRTGI